MSLRDAILTEARDILREELAPVTADVLIETSRRFVAAHQDIGDLSDLLRVFGAWQALTRATLGLPVEDPAATPPDSTPAAQEATPEPDAPAPAPDPAPVTPARQRRVRVGLGHPTNPPTTAPEPDIEEPMPSPAAPIPQSVPPELDDELTAAMSRPDF